MNKINELSHPHIEVLWSWELGMIPALIEKVLTPLVFNWDAGTDRNPRPEEFSFWRFME